jgi:hypothetical protein
LVAVLARDVDEELRIKDGKGILLRRFIAEIERTDPKLGEDHASIAEFAVFHGGRIFIRKTSLLAACTSFGSSILLNNQSQAFRRFRQPRSQPRRSSNSMKVCSSRVAAKATGCCGS